ncbi:MAG: efflux RND transporter periplasmic adaptor subunit, partial [Treponema sp.]|nr:efflux RND transporter periplasmic adaptor subunit [Treponema sp.]
MFDEKDDETATETQEKKKGKGVLIVLGATLVLAIGAGFAARFVWTAANYLSTDNARVTTSLIVVASNAHGALERFPAYEGRRVSENEIIGWVENGEAMRSPVDGIVIHTAAVQNQVMAPMEPVAVIADIGNLHVLANIEETDVARLRVGQSATVTIDPLGSRRFAGYVAEVGLVTAAELAGNAVFFNTGGTFTRVTHLLPVRINITDDVDLDAFIGVNARVRISLRSQAVGLGMAGNSPRAGAGANGIAVRGAVESVNRRNIYTTLGYMVDRVYVEVGERMYEGQMLGALAAEELAISASLHILNAE